MPSIHILSDLHTEFADIPVPAPEADVTVLAGDIHTRGRCSPWDNAIGYFGHPVLMVAGNHEFYGGRIESVPVKLAAKAQAMGITLLDNTSAVVAGVRFLGCTLWTDFRLFAGDDLHSIRAAANFCTGDRYQGGIEDFRLIRVAADGYRKFRPLDAATLHKKSVSWLRKMLETPFSGPTVVITHHAPSMQCLPQELRDPACEELTDFQRRDARFSPSYASALDEMIKELGPDIWIWGHIHKSVPPFTIGRTLMVSNPRGYPNHPNPAFDPFLTVRLPAPGFQPC
jgi:predicted phosphodiesterase